MLPYRDPIGGFHPPDREDFYAFVKEELENRRNQEFLNFVITF